MQPALASPVRPALKQIVSEAARALARLDAARLEELALCCQALNRDLRGGPTSDVTSGSRRGSNPDRDSALLPIKETERARLAAEAREARRDMALFARVLEATRANVQVIERLRELRWGQVEYKVGNAAGRAIDFDPRWPSAEPNQEKRRETRHGND